MRKEKVRKAWDKIADNYSIIIPPGRPSQDDCRIYGMLIKEALKGRKRPKIMLMGATPELRRVLYTFQLLQKADVLCLDINLHIYKAMGKSIMKFSKPREKFLKRSWLSTNFKSKSLDLVVGDEVICNVRSKKHEDLFKEVSRILKDDGFWITKHDIYTKKTEKKNARKILEEITKKILSGEYDFQYAANALMQQLFFYSGWKAGADHTLENHYRIMKKEYRLKSKSRNKKDLITKELVDIYKRNIVVMGSGHTWCMLSQKRSEEELKKYFTIKKKILARDYPDPNCSPIYLLKKKLIDKR